MTLATTPSLYNLASATPASPAKNFPSLHEHPPSPTLQGLVESVELILLAVHTVFECFSVPFPLEHSR